MGRPYLEWLRIENLRCIRSVDVHLTPLHAFIGPNDSGKSTLLRALKGARALENVERNARIVAWVHGVDWAYTPNGEGFYEGPYPSESRAEPSPEDQKVVLDALSPAAILRLDPDALREGNRLIPTGKPLWFSSDRGKGLAALYDALQSRDVDAFLAIRDEFVRLFPTVKTLRLENDSPDTKTLALTLVDGSHVGAHAMSEGMLYWLAFAVIRSLAPQAMLLVEEPENGLHPARIRDVMNVLRDVSTHTQVVLATHSPLVINEMSPDEVTIVTRKRETGTICTPMRKTKNFDERVKVYALGELWLSYADGDTEAGLTTGLDAKKAG